MKEFDFLEFHNNIKKDLLDAIPIIGDIERVEWNGMYSSSTKKREEYDGEYDFNKERLTDIFEAIKLKLNFAYEYLGLLRRSEMLDKELQKHTGKYGDLNFIPYLDVFYSPIKSIFEKHLNALTCHVKIAYESEYENTNSVVLLEQMLRGTAKMLTDRGIEPTNEAEVRNEVYRNLIHVFPDTVREIPITKISKSYKPDIGIKRLKSAIEYKFVSTDTEAKSAIGGIFEDIQGYEGSLDWTMFYAVIYMTDNFMTQDQIEAEFKLSKVPHHWKPIIVFGKGERKPKRPVKKAKTLGKKS